MKISRNYYTSLDNLPLWNWFKIQETDNLAYLKIKNTGKGYAPRFFADLFENMVYSFEKLDLSELRLRHKEAYMRAKYFQTGKIHFLHEADALANDIEKRSQLKNKKLKLSDFVNYIEYSLNNIGKLNPMEISTRRAFELYDLATELNKSKKIRNNGNNR